MADGDGGAIEVGGQVQVLADQVAETLVLVVVGLQEQESQHSHHLFHLGHMAVFVRLLPQEELHHEQHLLVQSPGLLQKDSLQSEELAPLDSGEVIVRVDVEGEEETVDYLGVLLFEIGVEFFETDE